MKEIDQLVITITEAMAKAAEACAKWIETNDSKVTAPDALRSFANAVRETNLAAERKDAPLH